MIRLQPETIALNRRIGQRLRELRISRNLSQMDIASKIGVTFQQIQKYEKGNNRISGATFCALAKALGVEPNSFFEGLYESRENVRSASTLHLVGAFTRMSREERALVKALVRQIEQNRGQAVSQAAE